MQGTSLKLLQDELLQFLASPASYHQMFAKNILLIQQDRPEHVVPIGLALNAVLADASADPFAKLLGLRFIKDALPVAKYSFMTVLNSCIAHTLYDYALFRKSQSSKERDYEGIHSQKRLREIGFSFHQFVLEIYLFLANHQFACPGNPEQPSNIQLQFRALKSAGVTFPDSYIYFSPQDTLRYNSRPHSEAPPDPSALYSYLCDSIKSSLLLEPFVALLTAILKSGDQNCCASVIKEIGVTIRQKEEDDVELANCMTALHMLFLTADRGFVGLLHNQILEKLIWLAYSKKLGDASTRYLYWWGFLVHHHQYFPNSYFQYLVTTSQPPLQAKQKFQINSQQASLKNSDSPAITLKSEYIEMAKHVADAINQPQLHHEGDKGLTDSPKHTKMEACDFGSAVSNSRMSLGSSRASGGVGGSRASGRVGGSRVSRGVGESGFSFKQRKQILKAKVLIFKNSDFQIGMISSCKDELLKADFFITPLLPATHFSFKLLLPPWLHTRSSNFSQPKISLQHQFTVPYQLELVSERIEAPGPSSLIDLAYQIEGISTIRHRIEVPFHIFKFCEHLSWPKEGEPTTMQEGETGTMQEGEIATMQEGETVQEETFRLEPRVCKGFRQLGKYFPKAVTLEHQKICGARLKFRSLTILLRMEKKAGEEVRFQMHFKGSRLADGPIIFGALVSLLAV